ncbi:AAA family ATPase [Niallia sp. Sow4_A1]|uniref:AAA family ATPase n=1 Tax=unclassified Niallia TaxID=2837522 RepID=UPI002041D64E|nr:MoxR family ATPase [Niallia sp. MER TA 168]MCM3360399.1 MoxR family ATPase [Niallia sp. MER TA 168]
MEKEPVEQDFIQAESLLKKVKEEIGKFIVGQEKITDEVLWSMLAGGHVLLEGLPGLGKTMMIRTISEVMNLTFARIQFTPDLMPADITGTMVLQPDEKGKQQFDFHEGPLFKHIVLADEINRATPKTQSALLEAMGEKTVTIMGETKRLEAPFFVLATQNPLDMEGTYPLPEAQLDRFLCKLHVTYPSKEELKAIIKRTTGTDSTTLNQVATVENIIHLQSLVKQILVADDILDIAVNIVSATHPGSEDVTELGNNYIQAGSGPRGLQSLVTMAKARALASGRLHVSIADLRYVALPVLRHRILLNFEGEIAGVTPDQIIEDILEKTLRIEAGKGR